MELNSSFSGDIFRCLCGSQCSAGRNLLEKKSKGTNSSTVLLLNLTSFLSGILCCKAGLTKKCCNKYIESSLKKIPLNFWSVCISLRSIFLYHLLSVAKNFFSLVIYCCHDNSLTSVFPQIKKCAINLWKVITIPLAEHT